MRTPAENWTRLVRNLNKFLRNPENQQSLKRAPLLFQLCVLDDLQAALPLISKEEAALRLELKAATNEQRKTSTRDTSGTLPG